MRETQRIQISSAGMQLYVHPSDPEFMGFHEGSIFADATVRNLLPAGQYYYSYELVEGVRSLLAAALEGLILYSAQYATSTGSWQLCT